MIKSWFVEGFPTQSLQPITTHEGININPIISKPIIDIENNPPASSTSTSLRPLDHSPQYLFSINPPITTTNCYTSIIDQPQQAAIQAIFAQMRNTQSPFTPPETEDHAAMIRAILAALSSSSSSSSTGASLHQLHQTVPHQTSTAFKNYSLSSIAPTTQISAHLRRQRMIKRLILFFRNLNFMRIHQRLQETAPTTTQLHHMISERKRREKLNNSFQSLRSLLPPGTKVIYK